MGGIRKLFINDEGLDKYVSVVMNAMRNSSEGNRFADRIEVKDYILKQLEYAKKLPNVQSIVITENGLIKLRTKELYITTVDTGIVRKFYMGNWLITMDSYCDIKWYPSSATVKLCGFRSNVWGNHTVHPHISGYNHEACLGNASTPLSLYYNTGEVKMLCIYLINYLQSVNVTDSAGCQLGSCKECELDENNNPIRDEKGNHVFKTTNEFIINDTPFVDKYTTKPVDLEHHEFLVNKRKCGICKKEMNRNWLEFIDNQDMYVCEDCKKTLKTCDVCGEFSKIDKIDPATDIHYCHNCATAFVKKCNFCDTDIFYPVDTKSEVPILDQLLEQVFNYESKDNAALIKNKSKVYYCDTCIGVIKQTKLPSNNGIITMRPAKFVDKKLVNIVDELPYNTYKMNSATLDDICFDNKFIENFLNPNYTNLPDVFKYFPAYSYIPGTLTKKFYRSKFVRVSSQQIDKYFFIKINKIDVSIRLNTDSTFVYPIAVFTDEIQKEILEKDTNEIEFIFDMTTKQRVTKEVVDNDLFPKVVVKPENKEKNNCIVCGREIEGNNYHTDKTGNKYCYNCSSNIKVECEECGVKLPISELAINQVPTDETNNLCLPCWMEHEVG